MINKEDKADVARHMGKALAKKVANVTADGGKKRGNYSIFKYDAKDLTKSVRVKSGLSHGDMHSELKSNKDYRGTDSHGFSGGRTYPRKK